MAIYEISNDNFRKIDETSFSLAGLHERQDLQRLLRTQIEIVSPDTLVIAEEFSQWEDSYRRIDLLGIDRNANLVVIELKRTADGGHMHLQSIRYAAMISAMTFARAVEVYTGFLNSIGSDDDASTTMNDAFPREFSCVASA
jgi:RecB family endonuclease NucS